MIAGSIASLVLRDGDLHHLGRCFPKGSLKDEGIEAT